METDYDYVTVSNETFQASRREYQNWRYAWAREILQNAIDAGANWIEIKINPDGMISVFDNGCGMTVPILREKLFVVSASGKSCQDGAVGGFGKAKELLYFGQKEYKIFTNDLFVHGYANRFKIINTNDNVIKGTKVEVQMDDKDFNVDNWKKYFKEFFALATWEGSVVLNGEIGVAKGKILEHVRDFTFGKMYHFGTENQNLYGLGRLHIRVGGIPMFSQYVDKQSLVLELEGKSYDLLTSNRDSLRDIQSKELHEFMWTLAKDTKSALLKKTCKIQIFRGKNGCITRHKNNHPQEVSIKAEELFDIKTTEKSLGGVTVRIEKQDVIKCDSLNHDFIIQNNSENNVPDQWYPNSFSKNANWVRAAWSLALYELHEIYNKDNSFLTGFIFCNDFAAMYGKNGPHDVFLLKPCNQDFTIRYSKTRNAVCEILSIACHEFIHSLGQSYHDEEFANALTDLISKVMIVQPHILKKMFKAVELGY